LVCGCTVTSANLCILRCLRCILRIKGSATPGCCFTGLGQVLVARPHHAHQVRLYTSLHLVSVTLLVASTNIMLGSVSTWMGDRCWQAGKPSRYVTSHLGQLSLAIPLWVGAMSTSESEAINRHIAQCTSPVSVVILQCKLVSR